MLDGLGGRQQTGIQGRGVFIFFNNALALFDDSLNRVAFLAFRLCFKQGEDFLETLDVSFSFGFVLLESSPQLFVALSCWNAL